MISNIYILISKELLNIKKFILQYILVLFLFPFLLFLFLAIPLSRVFVDFKPIYTIWVCSGILFVSILFNIYLLNLNWSIKLYDNSFIKSLPILSLEYLLSQIIYSLIIGLFQFIISVIVLNSLSIGFMTFMQFIKCFVNIRALFRYNVQIISFDIFCYYYIVSISYFSSYRI